MSIWSLRRIGALIFTFGAGWLTAQVETPYIFVLFGSLVVLWWLVYDFECERRYQKVQERDREYADTRHDRVY